MRESMGLTDPRQGGLEPMSRPKTLALINPMADYGIDTYTYELAQGLAANGVHVDAYCADASVLGSPPLHPNHRRYPVLGSRLWRAPSRTRSSAAGLQPHTNGSRPKPNGASQSAWRSLVRRLYLPAELGFYLKRRQYDAVWTKWAALA